MKNFTELDLPERNVGQNTWLVQASKMINCLWYCLLSDGSNELVAPFGDTKTDTFTFNTRIEALRASRHFYDLHNKRYPYIDEWHKEVRDGQTSSQIESQVMRFK